jgi:competence CoiA-like predicted nuclease
MPLMTKCLVTIEHANEIQKALGDIGDHRFLCPECKKPVIPHSAGGNQSAHFEHDERNPACTLSDKR